jgi:hypothetical protein
VGSAAYVITALVGSVVGVAELTSRYRDEPTSLVRMASAWIYLGINAGASVGALLLVRSFGWTFGVDAAAVVPTQVLTASFGAIALFRTSLFTLRVADQDIAIGPSVVLTSLLATMDRHVDRRRGRARSAAVGEIMNGVSFTKSRYALPLYCLALLQNLPLDEQARLRVAVDALAATELADRLKALNLGLLLINVTGVDVVKTAVEALRQDLTDETRST